MLNHTAEDLTELSRQITTPVYLIECGYGDHPYSSTNMIISTLGQTWVEGGARIVSMEDFGGFTLSIPNHSRDLSESALNRDWNGIECSVWLAIVKPKVYDGRPIGADDLFNGGFGETEMFLDADVVSTHKLARGSIVGVEISGGWINLICDPVGVVSNYTPNMKIMAPKFNHVPAVGEVFKWDNTTFTVGG